MKTLLLISICLFSTFDGFCQGLFSIDSNQLAKNNKRIAWDTLKYRKYERVLIVGALYQYRDFRNTSQQFMNSDKLGISKHIYTAESKLMSGFVLNYDKFSIAFTTKTQPQDFSTGKGNTKMFGIGLNFGDNRWVSENYYRKFTGFYDKNTANYDTAFKRTGNYYLQPNMSSSLFMSRFMFFSNHSKFSFKSGFGCNYRQLKSSASWIFGASFNVYNLQNDSSIFPLATRKFYNEFGNLKGFQSVNIAGSFGGAATLVLFKAWFINGYVIVGPEQQWRNYNLGVNYRSISYVSWSGTSRFSFGINMKRFYFLISNSNDFNLFNSKKTMSLKSNAVTQNITFGWRFHTKTPRFYQHFMKTKIYSFL